MLGGRKTTAALTGETLEGSVAKCLPQRGTLPHSREACLKTNSQRDSMGIPVKHWGMCQLHQQKIPKYCLTSSSGGL